MHSIRSRFVIIYLILVAIVFGVVAVIVTSIFEGYLVNQRIDIISKNANDVAVQVAPYLSQSDANSMYDIAVKNAQESGGIVLFLNSSGIVQTDSSSAFNGRRLNIREVNEIIYGRNSSAYGYHQILNKETNTDFWAVYYTSAVINNGQIIGAVLHSSSIQDVVLATDALGMQMLWLYIFACVAIIISSIISTGYITKPVNQLTDVAIKISSGDLSNRAQISGKGEIAELGQTFNMMCDRLQNIDKQRSEFVSDASHELKTPLASMKILVESLLYQDEVKEDVYKEFLSDINSEIDRLNSLITDLLLISKMDSDNVMLNFDAVNLTYLVNKSISALTPIAKAKNIKVTTNFYDDVTILGDELKLRQALNNLIENAIKYSKADSKVNIKVKKAGQDVIISIKDNGVGMSEEHLNHIFERFYRVDKARSRETGGTGLGLHIVRRIALMHKGRVEVQSKENVGSVFRLILPITQNLEGGNSI